MRRVLRSRVVRICRGLLRARMSLDLGICFSLVLILLRK